MECAQQLTDSSSDEALAASAVAAVDASAGASTDASTDAFPHTEQHATIATVAPQSRAQRALFQFDPGWPFVVTGLGLIVAGVLIPAQRDLHDLRGSLTVHQALLEHSERRLDAYDAFVTEVNAGEPQLVRRLAASQLNRMPVDERPFVMLPTMNATVSDWIDDSEPLVVPTPNEFPDTLLSRLATGPRRLWVLASGVFLVFVGLVFTTAPAVSPRRQRNGGRFETGLSAPEAVASNDPLSRATVCCIEGSAQLDADASSDECAAESAIESLAEQVVDRHDEQFEQVVDRHDEQVVDRHDEQVEQVVDRHEQQVVDRHDEQLEPVLDRHDEQQVVDRHDEQFEQVVDRHDEQVVDRHEQSCEACDESLLAPTPSDEPRCDEECESVDSSFAPSGEIADASAPVETELRAETLAASALAEAGDSMESDFSAGELPRDDTSVASTAQWPDAGDRALNTITLFHGLSMHASTHAFDHDAATSDE